MADDPTTVPLAEEELVIGKRPVERSAVRVSVRVEEDQHRIPVTLQDQEVTVERVPADELVDALPQTIDDGTTLTVPVVEEVVILQKRFRIRERILITRLNRTREVEVPASVRREIADIDWVEPKP
jgi:uncharacterized protein (TIGR02271 family)